MSIQLEVGKTYRRRNGGIAKIIRKAAGTDYPFIADDGESYTDGGRKFLDSEDHADFIALADEPAAPEVAPQTPAKTLRDEFAMAALTGLINTEALSAAAIRHEKGVNYCFTKVAAGSAYEFADAMLAAREKSA